MRWYVQAFLSTPLRIFSHEEHEGTQRKRKEEEKYIFIKTDHEKNTKQNNASLRGAKRRSNLMRFRSVN